MTSKKASFSIASLIAIIAAFLSLKFGAILGLLCAAVAFIFGCLGLILALSSQTRGGILSMVAIGLSFIGVIAAIVKAIMWFF